MATIFPPAILKVQTPVHTPSMVSSRIATAPIVE
jgi:hypothetical protein